VESIENKREILSKVSKLKGSSMFINQDLISRDQDQLGKEIQKVKDVREASKWEIITNIRVIIKDNFPHKKNRD